MIWRPVLVAAITLPLLGACTGTVPTAREPARAIQPSNDLERLLVKADADPRERAAFEQAFLSSEVYFVVDEPSVARVNQHGGKVPPGTRIDMLVVPHDGAMVMPVYTSLPLLLEVHGETSPWVRMSGRGALEVRAGYPVVVNQGRAPTLFWSDPEAEALLGRSATR